MTTLITPSLGLGWQSLPKFWDNNRVQLQPIVSGLVDQCQQGPRAEVVPNKTRSGENEPTGWLYELQLTQPLPIIDLSRTPLSSLLPSSIYSQAVRYMHKVSWLLVWLNRFSVVLLGCLLFSPAHTARAWMPLIGVLSLIPPLCFLVFLSLDLLARLGRNYEFWFISGLSTITWISLSRILGDSRAVACLSLWLSSQLVVSIDGNYRTYSTVVKSIVMAGPSVMMVVIGSAYKLIPDSSFPTQSVGILTFKSRQLVLFTAPTLVVFMYKKAYLRVRRQRAQSRRQRVADDHHIISCVVLHARMRLVPVIFKQQLRLGTFNKHQAATALSTQQLRLAQHGSILVDSRRILLSEKQFKRFAVPQVQATLYVLALVGLTSTATCWILVFYHAERHLLSILGVIAATCSLLFMLLTIILVQRDLMSLLMWNFDVLFSTFQATTLVFCLLDLLRWDVSSSLAVASWWFWFHWILLIDALTPRVTLQLQLRKFALPVLLLVLPIAAVCAVEILVGDGKTFTSRLVWSIHLSRLGTFDMHTDTLAVERIVTIIGWNARIVLELVLCDPAQLLFIRRPIEYASPYLTFTEPLVRVQPVKETEA